jgi:HAD superfamily phosphatase (TIGR01668 family)
MNILKPTKIYDSVSSIDFDDLRSLNIKGILIDIDNTLIDMYRNVPKEIFDWIRKAKENGFKMLVLSNTNNRKKVKFISESFDLECVSFAMKPLKWGYNRALKKIGLKAEEVCMIGDQIFTDVLGANRLKIASIYVKPISKKEYWYTAWKRAIENSIIKKYEC